MAWQLLPAGGATVVYSFRQRERLMPGVSLKPQKSGGNSCLILSDLSKVWGIYLFLIPPGHENIQWVVLIIWLLTLETFLNIKVSKEMKKRVKMILFH